MTQEHHREIVTPEGVPLRFMIAGVGDRVAAFLIDGLMILGAAIVVAIVIGLGAATSRGLGLAAGFVAFFLLRNFYFTWFECRWHGTTPGKRAVGLRVIDAHGGILTAEAVFARNLMREVEVFLPLVAVLAPESLIPGVSGPVRLLAVAWLFVLALLPVFNRDRLRVGDLVGGTLVVRAPRAALREDLSAARPRAGAQAAPTFTNAQLDLYGIHELQVLESLLRQLHPRWETMEAVAEKIQRKIGWVRPPGPRQDPEDFLRAFYTAQRARLEHRLLLGERRETKRAGQLIRRP